MINRIIIKLKTIIGNLLQLLKIKLGTKIHINWLILSENRMLRRSIHTFRKAQCVVLNVWNITRNKGKNILFFYL